VKSFTFTVIPEAGIRALRGVIVLGVSTVSAIFLASNLTQGRLARRAHLVYHTVFEFVSACSVSDDRNFLLWQSDWLAAARTNVTAHRPLGLHNTVQIRSVNPSRSDLRDRVQADAGSWRVCGIVFCEANPASLFGLDLCNGSLSMKERDRQEYPKNSALSAHQ
jgi:hypothetical protein